MRDTLEHVKHEKNRLMSKGAQQARCGLRGPQYRVRRPREGFRGRSDVVQRRGDTSVRPLFRAAVRPACTKRSANFERSK